MKIKLYFDEDVSYKIADDFRLRGIDVLTAHEADMLGKLDIEQLEFAILEDRVLFSFNVGDFQQLHNEFLAIGREHAGILLAKQQHFSLGELLRRIIRFTMMVSAEEMRNRLEFLSSWG